MGSCVTTQFLCRTLKVLSSLVRICISGTLQLGVASGAGFPRSQLSGSGGTCVCVGVALGSDFMLALSYTFQNLW